MPECVGSCARHQSPYNTNLQDTETFLWLSFPSSSVSFFSSSPVKHRKDVAKHKGRRRQDDDEGGRKDEECKIGTIGMTGDLGDNQGSPITYPYLT